MRDYVRGDGGLAMTEHPRNVRAQDETEYTDAADYIDRMMPVLRATVEVELMRKRVLGLPISPARGEGPQAVPGRDA